ncbi:MAG: HD domain-containing protein [Chloroflexi bacterium]|nr:HD domain-containing protein [Chloroflexota bacterium]
MNPERQNSVSGDADDVRPDPDDPVLAALRQVQTQYREMYAALQQRSTAVLEQLDHARRDEQRLQEQQETLRRERDVERSRADRHRAEANALASALKDIHGSIFSGNVYELILKACVTLTGATRGLYLTSVGAGDSFQVRAAIDVNGYPASPPSELVTALSRAALDHQSVMTYPDTASLPEKPPDAERFRNCLVAPVVLRNDLSGVTIVADKAGGDFDQGDSDVLLSVGSQAAIAIENNRLQHEVQEAYLSIVTVLAETMAARAQYAAPTDDSACRLAIMLAERLGLSEYDRSVVYYATLLHDIGNVAVTDGVLNKPGPLLDAERELIRAHAQIGHDLLRQIPILEPVANIVRHHHERYDGGGYPDGLGGAAIPMPARIVAVVDAYFSMLAPRSYRLELSPELACDQLRQGSGTQFDPRVVDAFLSTLHDTGEHGARRIQAVEVPLPGLAVQHASRNVVSA